MAAIPVGGRVIDHDGRPVGGAAIMFSASPVPVPDIAELTGPDGRFTLGAPTPGRYVLSARASAGAPVTLEIDVGAAPPPDLEIVIGGGNP